MKYSDLVDLKKNIVKWLIVIILVVVSSFFYLAPLKLIEVMIDCQTAHCGRHKPHFDFGDFASSIAQSCR